MSRLRLNVLDSQELKKAQDDGSWLIRVYSTGFADRFAILEQEVGEGSAEGPSWQPVEVVI